MIGRSLSCLVLSAVLLTSSVVSFGQVDPLKKQPATQTPRTVSAGEFLQAPREMRQQLKAARKALEEKDYAGLALTLGALAEPLAKEDFMVFEAGQPQGRGMKTQRSELFSKMPEAGWESFETLHGMDASRALQAAVEQGTLAGLENVAQRWRYTEAGDHATLLVARRALDEHRWQEAARRLAWLVASPRGFQYEPETSVLLASAQLMLGKDEDAARTLETLRGKASDARVRIGGEQVRLFGGEPLAILRTQLGGLETVRPEGRRQNAHPEVDRQALLAAVKTKQPGWKNEVVDVEKDRATVEQLIQSHTDRSTPALGLLIPQFIGGQIVHRTSERLVSVDRSGRTNWAYPFDYESSRITTAKVPQPAGVQIRMPGLPAATLSQQRLRERLWTDQIYGRFSTNERYVFAIDRLPPTTDPRTMSNLRFQIMRRNNNNANAEFKLERYSRLVALDLQRGGALVWAVGDKTGYMEPLLSKTFFLGAPLCLDGRLYALVERDEVVELVALDDTTGKLVWSIKIAQMANRSIGLDSMRRLQGATPVFWNGLLICPTSVGGLCAIDPISRSFVWGAPSQRVTGTTKGRVSPTRFAYAPPPGSDWAEIAVRVAGDRLLVTQRSGSLRCLDARTGEELWNRTRRDLVTVGCVTDEAAVLVGQFRITAVKLADGEPYWANPYVAIPAGGAPAGHGVYDGEHFYLPTTDPELLQIHVATGAVERFEVDAAWGNLAVDGKVVVDQSPLHMQLRAGGASPADVEATIAQDQLEKMQPNDLVQLFRDKRFAVRESAAAQLKSRRETAIVALAEGVQQGDAETAYRSRGVLLSFIRDDDEKISESAKTALVEAEKNSVTLIGATSIEDEIAGQSEKALTRLRQRGAIIGAQGRTVVIRQNWKGEAKDLVALKWLNQIISLEMTHKSINDETLDHVRGLTSLTSINLRGSGVTDAGIAKLNGLTNLRTLLLQNTGVTDTSIDHIGKHQRLRAINLLNTKISQEGVRRLKALLPRAQVVY
ncbi:MAG: PQQ-binding-like beta-propeller repeat protein [Pirellulaceae bacterium]|nr:PQQ-binding-like beta-propeller repeat protein [Pirellulaceae bacterium]